MELSLKDIKELIAPTSSCKSEDHPYEVGKIYHIRTVTMAILGRLKAVYASELVFEEASWIADAGRFNEYLTDTSECADSEPFKNDVIVGRGALIDMTEVDKLFHKVK